MTDYDALVEVKRALENLSRAEKGSIIYRVALKTLLQYAPEVVRRCEQAETLTHECAGLGCDQRIPLGIDYCQNCGERVVGYERRK